MVQTDGGFVEDVEDAFKAGANLGGETNSLGFTTGEGVSTAAEGQVAKADLFEELKAKVDLAADLGGDESLALGHDAAFHEVASGGDGKRGDFGDVLVIEGDGEGFFAETSAVAVGAYLVGHEVFDPFGKAVAGFATTSQQRDEPLPAAALDAGALAGAVVVGPGDGFGEGLAAGAEEDEFAAVFGKFGPGYVDIEIEGSAELFPAGHWHPSVEGVAGFVG